MDRPWVYTIAINEYDLRGQRDSFAFPGILIIVVTMITIVRDHAMIMLLMLHVDDR